MHARARPRWVGSSGTGLHGCSVRAANASVGRTAMHLGVHPTGCGRLGRATSIGHVRLGGAGGVTRNHPRVMGNRSLKTGMVHIWSHDPCQQIDPPTHNAAETVWNTDNYA